MVFHKELPSIRRICNLVKWCERFCARWQKLIFFVTGTSLSGMYEKDKIKEIIHRSDYTAKVELSDFGVFTEKCPECR